MSRIPYVDLEVLDVPQAVEADVCVIGAGAAGIYLANKLARSGRQVVLLEAGPERTVASVHAGFECEMDLTDYSGAISGRFFGLGGTTAHWGGLLVPHTDCDVREGEDSEWAWRHILEAIKTSAALVLADLGYSHGTDFETWPAASEARMVSTLRGAGVGTMSALHLPFRRKNLVSLLDVTSPQKERLKIYIGAVAKAWDGAPENSHYRIRTVHAVSLSGNRVSVSAKNFVIAAGALESARMLLEINADADGQVLRSGAAPGAYLTDHLSLPIADVPDTALRRTAALFAPHFSGAWMRSLRFVDGGLGVFPARGFAHFNFVNRSPGFELARKSLQAVQQRQWPVVSTADILSGVSDITRLAGARVFRSRLYIPAAAHANLQLDIEQRPSRENCIRLTERRDRLGRRVPAIRWSISQADQTCIEIAARSFLKAWPGKAAGLPQLDPCKLDLGGGKLHDAYHPAGTTRMGNNADAVVDQDLRVRGTENLYVASTGVLPSAGSANPTFSMLCLTHKLAERLATCRK
jgi:choline dehydrogenase-like flavoprotein